MSTSSSDIFALAIHADYRCRHSGACCSADWDVPVELPVYRTLHEAITGGRLQVRDDARHLHPFVVEPDLPDGAAAMLERTETGACIFLDRHSRLCIVHRDLGEPALPSTCRHFPRLAVRDARGTFITMSHFCPTAASMLFREDRPLTIVSDPPAFPPADYEGLTVTPDDLPPLLTPTMLMDLPGYMAWEQHMVRRCAGVGRTPESVVATLWRDARTLRCWTPTGPALAEAVAALPSGFVEMSAPETIAGSLDLWWEVLRAVPDELRPEPDLEGVDAAYLAWVRAEWLQFAAPLSRYLGAKAFASWTAYQGRGVATIVRGLEAALAVVRVEASRQCRDNRRPLDAALLLEAFRRADFTLNHLAVGEDLARIWSTAESDAEREAGTQN
jgi:Fe-S-cluster containining protein